jgi:hypothetical protein
MTVGREEVGRIIIRSPALIANGADEDRCGGVTERTTDQ